MNKHVALKRAMKNLTASSSLIFQLMQVSDTRASVSIWVKQAAGFLCFLNFPLLPLQCIGPQGGAITMHCASSSQGVQPNDKQTTPQT